MGKKTTPYHTGDTGGDKDIQQDVPRGDGGFNPMRTTVRNITCKLGTLASRCVCNPSSSGLRCI